MRFSSTLASSNHHTPSISSIKKALSTLVNKIPHHPKVGPTVVKNDPHTVIRVVAKTAIKKDNDMNRDLRNYYTSKKRQLEEESSSHNDNLNVVAVERENRHKTVKQYQQTGGHHHSQHHWIEHSNPPTVNKSAQQPKWANTHGYVRDTRSNSDYLRKLAITTNNAVPKSCRKRSDEFVWGRQSPLRNVV
ncbi:uncharacterized protein EV154DRAFT_308000 [Mucor mucedo]|uniref:Uncharacterized protein n=1 Tax=Mucor saturninus TaxID=64648 RepID=A0A8H7QLP9_9FUNG|nr:uncharacterized protein EV154DRAFT_308000 [Mucor mucedo]KAG2194380.1 hypothetical protein INT47_006695 [Mucor saturninus]KAI7888455.1 hypothetical protein EV154DRAFT_308000 [Mucor mucedo]